jgi:hypothetical protein
VRRTIELRAADNVADALAGKRPRDAVNRANIPPARLRTPALSPSNPLYLVLGV